MDWLDKLSIIGPAFASGVCFTIMGITIGANDALNAVWWTFLGVFDLLIAFWSAKK